MEAATAGELEAATAGEYDENPEQTLRMLQRRGENSTKQTNQAVKFGICSFASKRLVVACRCVRSHVGVWAMAAALLARP